MARSRSAWSSPNLFFFLKMAALIYVMRWFLTSSKMKLLRKKWGVLNSACDGEDKSRVSISSYHMRGKDFDGGGGRASRRKNFFFFRRWTWERFVVLPWVCAVVVVVGGGDVDRTRLNGVCCEGRRRRRLHPT